MRSRRHKWGFLIKMPLMGIRGMDILNNDSDKSWIWHVQKIWGRKWDTPRQCEKSPTVLCLREITSLEIVSLDMGRSLLEDDGALWKKLRNLDHVVKKQQDGINQVEMWGKKWGFQLSVEKTKVMFFTRRRIFIWSCVEII